MMVECLPTPCKLNILRLLDIADIMNCKYVCRKWCAMVRQWWSDAVTKISIPGDFVGIKESSVSESKALQILEYFNCKLVGLEIKLRDSRSREPNRIENIMIFITNRFPALQSLSLHAQQASFDGHLLLNFEALRRLNICGFELQSENHCLVWNTVLPQFRFLRELNLQNTNFVLSEDQVHDMPTNFFLFLEVLSFTDIQYEKHEPLCLFIRRCKHLRKFGLCGEDSGKGGRTWDETYIPIAMLIASLHPPLKALKLRDLRCQIGNQDEGNMLFDDIINRFPELEEADLCWSVSVQPRPFHNVALRKLVLVCAEYKVEVIGIIADAPFQLIHFEAMVGWGSSGFMDESLACLMNNQKQLEVFKLNGVWSSSANGLFFHDILKHPKMNMAYFSNMVFDGLPKHLQNAMDIILNPSSIADLANRYQAAPLSLHFYNCSFIEEEYRRLRLNISPFALKYIQVSNEHNPPLTAHDQW